MEFFVNLPILLILILSVFSNALAFKDGEEISVLAAHIGPFSNPSETYPYYYLPFCGHESSFAPSSGVADTLAGDRKVPTGYQFKFKENVERKILCTAVYNEEALEKFARAVEEDWFFEMFLDDLPLWGYIGEHSDEDYILGHTELSKHYLYTHLTFSIGYNGENIVEVNVSTPTNDRVDITLSGHDLNLRDASRGRNRNEERSVTFIYDVYWHPSSVPYESREDLYKASHFAPLAMEIHWVSLINSLVLNMSLIAFLVVSVSRLVNHDLARYMKELDEESGGEEESGWKLLYGDVFRAPSNSSFFSALFGSGVHLFSTFVVFLVLSLFGTFSLARRGSSVVFVLLIFIVCSSLAGYSSARLFKQLEVSSSGSAVSSAPTQSSGSSTTPVPPSSGKRWVWNIVMSLLVFVLPLSLVFSVLNATAAVKSSTAALPAATVLLLVVLFVCIGLPLGVLGGILGKNSSTFDYPCRTNRLPRQIPEVEWLGGPAVQYLVAGIFPFASVYIELRYIFASLWGHKLYTLHGILLLAFLMLCITTASIVVTLTFFQLGSEDHRWHWRAFVSGGMVGVYLYIYTFIYYFWNSDLSGFLQTAFYFGYMAVVSLGCFLVMGSVGFLAAFIFVKYIYSRVKVD